MTTKNAGELPNFDAAAYLADKEALAAFVTDLLQDDHGPELLLSALGELARARGMVDIATASGMTPAELDEAMNAGGNPSFDAVRRILTALGLRLVAVPCAVGVEDWLRGHVGPAYDAMKAAPSSALTAGQVRERLALEYAKRLKGQ